MLEPDDGIEVSEREYNDMEQEIRGDCCPEWYIDKDGKEIFCEGEFNEEVEDDELTCSVCGCKVNILEKALQRIMDRSEFDD